MAKSKSSSVVERLDKLNEFDREPVPANRLQGGRYFAGLFAGEHVAATEFVIGALFVSLGAGTFDVIVGLIFGNLLAVLSWALVCAPIAVRTRLTLYWYLKKIGGPGVTVIYNILNALLFCILAGAMFTVSASAIRLPFGIPDQVRWYPTDIRFVLIVFGVGAVVVILAIWGFKKLSQFAQVCSPWMLLMFICGALAVFPTILASIPEVESIHSFSDFWRVADARIWTGVVQPGQKALGFWHIMSFAFMCNLGMNLGLSDMALFRYAKRASYGFYSAFGMYLGHYLAWICAGIMGAGAAIVLKTPLIGLDSGSVAYTALGAAGAIAVVIAGWTTANPTLYRVGLALQVVTPNWRRWRVTLVAGTVTTIIACFPFVFTKLLGFVGIYGLILMPAGTIVFVEYWLFPRLGLTQYWISRKGGLVNWPALVAWFVPVIGGFALWQLGYIHLFFLTVPIWVCTAVLYVVLSFIAGAGKEFGEMPQEQVPVPETPSVSVEQKAKPSRNTATYYITGLIAVASLLVSLGMALWVSRSGGDVYTIRLEYFKKAILYLTMIYFIFGTIWLYLREKKKD